MKNKIITVVGLGILGGSYAMGLTNAENTVYAIDINQESIDFAKINGYISDGDCQNYEAFLAKSDLIVLGLYPTVMLQWLKNNIHLINKTAIITDVSGVKQNIVDKAQEIAIKHGIEFYSAHPMRGKEVLGVQNADCSIFKNANIILVPTEQNTIHAESFIIDMAKTLGFTTISKLSPKEHDEMIAYLSQLTHVIAVCLMNSNDNPDIVKYSGDSFRDLTRIAKINENLWGELFHLNKESLCNQIDIFEDKLQNLRNYILNNDIENMNEMFRISTNRRKEFDKNTK